jgi:hypothetical protein
MKYRKMTDNFRRLYGETCFVTILFFIFFLFPNLEYYVGLNLFNHSLTVSTKNKTGFLFL